MKPRTILLVLALALPVGACGGVTLGTSSDAAAGDVGRSPARGIDSGPAPVKTVDGGTPGVDGGTTADGGSGPMKGFDAGPPVRPTDGGPVPFDGGPSPEDGGADADAHHGLDAGLTYVDAGYYHGDGAFFVEGGAYPDVGSPRDAATAKDAGAVDSGLVAACATLADCCASLQGASQSFCSSTATSNDSTDCSVEQAQLTSGGDCMGASVLASQLQLSPARLVSDGITLFWTTNGTPGLLAMPVGGGAITTLLSGRADGDFLALDDVNIYVMEPNLAVQGGGIWNLIRIPRNGSPPTLVTESGAWVMLATTLGSTAFWVENAGEYRAADNPVAVKSAPLQGGSVSVLAMFDSPNLTGPPVLMGVTSSEVFVGYPGPALYDFSMTVGALASVAAGGTSGESCSALTSDADGVYCAESSGSNLTIASNGTTTTLGAAVNSSCIVFDDTYAYWADMTPVGTIMKAPKVGGGTATVLARDTSPTAIAVDSNAIYWSDAAGYIKSVPK